MGNKLRSISLIMVITLVSKCLGFARDMVMTYYYGAGNVTDSYLVAQQIPETLLSLIVQVISISFIPIYMEALNNEGEKRANRFVDNFLLISEILSLLVILIVILFPRFFVSLFANGFDESKASLAATFTSITVIAVIFRITNAIYRCYMNAKNKFIIPSLQGIIFDTITIATIIIGYYTKTPVMLAVGIVAAAFIQLVIMLPYIIKQKGIKFTLDNPFSDKYVKKVLTMILPIAIGVGVYQINLLVDRRLASSFGGGVSSLNLANKVNNILENVVVLSLTTIMFPAFSAHAAEGNKEELTNDVAKSLALTITIMGPATVFLFIFSPEIIAILFGRGAFDAAAVTQTSGVMVYYTIGLLFLSVNAILNRVLYSLKKVKYSTISSSISLAVNIALNIILIKIMGLNGLALATSISCIISTILITIFTGRFIGFKFISRIKWDLIKCFGASIVAAMIAYFSHIELEKFVSSNLSCVICGLFGIAVYCVVSILTKNNIVCLAFRILKSKMLRKSTNGKA